MDLKNLNDLQKKMLGANLHIYLNLSGYPENDFVSRYREIKELEKKQFEKELNDLPDEKIKQTIQTIYENNMHFNMASKTNFKMCNNFSSKLKNNLSELYSALEQNPISLSDILVNAVIEAQKNTNAYAFNVDTQKGSRFASGYDLTDILNSKSVFTEQRGLNMLRFSSDDERQEQKRRYRYPSGPDSSTCA